MTNRLVRRITRHRDVEEGTYTGRYQSHRLVDFEYFQYVRSAIARETELKRWNREARVALIEKMNPTWEDLAAGWGEAAMMRVSGKAGSSPALRAHSE